MLLELLELAHKYQIQIFNYIYYPLYIIPLTCKMFGSISSALSPSRSPMSTFITLFQSTGGMFADLSKITKTHSLLETVKTVETVKTIA